MQEATYPHISGRTRTIPKKPRGLKLFLAKTEIQKQHELLYALEKVSRVLTVQVQLQKILEDMAQIVVKALGAKWVNFWELTQDKQAVHITATSGMKQSYVEQSRQHPIRLGTAWIGRAVKTGRAWGTNDILTDTHLMKDLGQSWKDAVKKQKYRALLCVPTISKRGVLGGMCVYYPDPHEFTDFEMRLMTVAANQAATAITNSQIFDDLIAEKNKTIAMLNSLADGLVVYDLHGVITAFNPKTEELLWLNRNMVLKKNIRTIPTRGKQELQNLKELSLLEMHEFESREFSIAAPQRMSLLITHLPVRDAQDRKIGTMRVLHDITKEKEAEELKSSFISIASHQLRTPLSGIKWALNLLQEEAEQSLSQQHKDLIAKTYQTNERLIALVNDLLDTSRIEEGRFGYEFQKTDLVSLAQKTLEELAPLITERPTIKITFETPATPLPLISADPKKLTMALYNVFENAIKYTPKGHIKIVFKLTSSSINIIVSDEGIGIPEEQQKFLFTKFFRARNAILLQTEGSGLGLWIANEIIKKHNGKVVLVESAENEGTTFLLRFPIDPKRMPKGKVKGL
ncbi:MAG: GAF sensor signal transduction histidine kinase [Parcubacteria group bacterium GW2011_GWA2_50_10]|nr:MAG: GAF sensor signal transduction histidine kinase [Parcubacteria group bacterium GW2011_GWA2_50_10]